MERQTLTRTRFVISAIDKRFFVRRELFSVLALNENEALLMGYHKLSPEWKGIMQPESLRAVRSIWQEKILQK